MNSLQRTAASAATGRSHRWRVPRYAHTLLSIVAFFTLAAGAGAAGFTGPTESEWRELVEQNRRLLTAVENQQREIAALRDRIDTLDATGRRQQTAITELRTAPAAASRAEPPAATQVARDRADPGLIISGEAGLAFFHGSADAAYPNSEFRVDEAKLFVEARAARNVYVFAELDVTLRELNDEYFHLGEAYLEFEDPLTPLGVPEGLLTVRAGRLDVPFGEEYQRRGVMTNPLVTHSLADFWGVDEGVEIFGRTGRFDYVFAVQNGGHKTMHDFHSNKALTGRLGFSPVRGVRFAASAMRTGKLDRANDGLSEIWIGNAFFRSVGAAATTTTFRADLAQLEGSWTWASGHVRGDYGRAWYDDDDTAADNQRTLAFWQFEVRQDLRPNFYGAVRYSRITSDRGYPIVGLSGFGKYFYNSPPTREISRVGLGLGYRLGEDILLKLEYTNEEGELVTSTPRKVNQWSAEAGVRF